MSAFDSLLAVRSLRVESRGRQGGAQVLRGVDLDVGKGEIVGVIGESGSGKTTTALAILHLLPAGLRVAGGQINFAGQDLVTLNPRALQALRGGRIAMIFQDALRHLNPVFSVGDQLTAVIRAHHPELEKAAVRARAIELFEQVQIVEPERRLRSYPHQFSGGMAQRVMIAMALAGNPELLLADEPTSALDVSVQAQILNLLGELRREFGLTYLAQRLPATIELTFWTLILAIPIGVVLGVLAAAFRGSWFDRLVQGYSVLGLGIPVFWLSLMAVYVFFFLLGWVAAPVGRLGITDTPPPNVTGLYVIDSILTGDRVTLASSINHLVLPVFSLVLIVAAPIARMTYSCMCGELASDYARAATAAGLPRRAIVGKYALKNVAIPIVTMVGISVRNLITGAVLTEIVFAWPGIGRYAVESMLVADLAPVQAVVLIVTVFTFLVNILVDVSYYWFDPRLGVS